MTSLFSSKCSDMDEGLCYNNTTEMNEKVYIMGKEKDRVLQQQEKKQQSSEEKQGVAKMAGFAIFILVALMFTAVLFISYFFEMKFGKTAGTIALIVIAVLIAFYLYRQEILEKIKRKK